MVEHLFVHAIPLPLHHTACGHLDSMVYGLIAAGSISVVACKNAVGEPCFRRWLRSCAGTTLIMGVVGYSRRTFETW